MHIVALRNLESYWHRPGRSDAEGPLKAWFAEAKLAQWTCPQDVKNSYRLYKESMGVGLSDNDMMQYVYVKFIGTHAEYDRVDAAVVDQFKGV